jgi:hypothetical protein
VDDDFLYTTDAASYADYQFIKASGNILFLAIMPFILWYFLWKFLASKSSAMGLTYLIASIFGLGGGIAWVQNEMQNPSTYQQPKCYKTDTCNFMSGVPLHEQ